MSEEFTVSESVKEHIKEILANNNFDPNSDVVYKPGSQLGDGYMSETIAVDIRDKDKSLHLFLKCSRAILSNENFKTIFPIETFFYEVLHPAYVNFQKKHNVEDVFHNVPKLYGVMKSPQEIISLENLSLKGYELFSRYDFYNDEHLTLILKTFAKFHAISFAFKDQERDIYESWRGNLFDYMSMVKIGTLSDVFETIIGDFFSKLDPVEDSDILLAFSDIVEVIKSSLQTLTMDYTIITKGDCWNNNMLFLYDGENKEKPTDISLIDWQVMKESSPINDLLAIVHPMATKDMLDNMDHYLKVYHDELSLRIRELGSDPDILYPYSVFLKQWDEKSYMAFGNNITLLKMMLTQKSETADMEKMFEAKVKDVTDIFPQYQNNDIYMSRLKDIARHLIKRKRANFRKTKALYDQKSLN